MTFVVDGFHYDLEYKDIAEENGIPYSTLRRRISLGWDVEEAATKPVYGYGKNQWADIAEQNGISRATFFRRLRSGWGAKKAATKPVMTFQEVGKLTKGRRHKYDSKIVNLAKENGISYSTFVARVNSGWDEEKAATTKVQKSSKWAKVAKDNGISYKSFYSRVKRLGWDEEKAATTPIMSPKEAGKQKRGKHDVYDVDLIQLAKKNGIKYRTFVYRVHHGLSQYEAATKPLRSGGYNV